MNIVRIWGILNLVLAINISSCGVTPAFAQDEEKAIPANIEQGKDAIEIPQTKSDAQISKRLQKVLSVTGWYSDLHVTSDEGVVTISGKASEAGQRDWAQALTKETDGVVAVINKLELSELGWFDLSPASKELKTFWKISVQFVPYLVASVLLFIVSLLIFKISSRGIRRLWSYQTKNPILIDVLSSVTALPIILIGIYLVLKLLGLTGLALTLLGGTGAAGLVAGFAFKNILENYFSGIMLSLRKPFVIGDIIEVAGQSGVVFKMTTRGTTLVDSDGNHVLIPNATVYANIIKNHSINPITRTKISFDLPASLDRKRTQEEVKKFLSSRPEIVKDPVTEVNLSRGKLEVSVWVDSRKANVEKLKTLLTNKIEESISSGMSVDLYSDGHESTKNNVKEILKRAESHQPDGHAGRDLINEQRA